MARSFFANYRRSGRKVQIYLAKRFTVLCDCNNGLHPTPEAHRKLADDGTCKFCGRRPYLDLRQHGVTV